MAHGRAWATSSFDLQRTGFNPYEHRLGVDNVGGLAERWHDAAGTYVDTSPVLAPDVKVGSFRQDLLLFGTEEGAMYAVNAESGDVVWRRQLGSRIGLGSYCYKSRFGITATPALDEAAGRVYVVDGDNRLYALEIATGSTVRGWPVMLPGVDNPRREHVWSGLTELGSNLYVAEASDCDDPPYQGRLVEVSAGPAPGVARVFHVEPAGTSGGGIWGWGGVAVDPAGTKIYVATGNAIAHDEDLGYANSVLELSVDNLAVLGHNNPSIPRGGGDWDFGSTPVLYQVPGCPLQLAVESKIGSLFVYDAGSISPSVRPQQISLASGRRADFIGDAAYSPVTHLLYVSDASGASAGPSGGASAISYLHGIVAFRTLASCRLDPNPVWQGPDLGPSSGLRNPMSDPTIANGVVYFASGRERTVYALDASTGKTLWMDHLSSSNGIYGAPVVVNGWLYVPTWFGMYAFHT